MDKRPADPLPRPKRFYVADPELPDFGDAVSATECTGLIPAIEPNENGTEAYRQLFAAEMLDFGEPKQM